MRTIVVTGATGTIGRAVIEFLAVEPDVAIRAATRHPRLLCAEVLSQRVTPVEFDWDAPNAIDDIVSGADTVLLLPPGGHHPLPTAGLLLASAVTAGVRHVVFPLDAGCRLQARFRLRPMGPRRRTGAG